MVVQKLFIASMTPPLLFPPPLSHRRPSLNIAGPFTRATVLLLLVVGLSWRAGAAVILPDGANPRHISEGELLLGELNCAACHTAPAPVLSRLDSRRSPSLQGIGSRVTASFIRSFLSYPASVKPGTTMPDSLHQLDAARKREVVDALTHYLVSERAAEAGAVQSDDGVIARGRVLYHEVGCAACHAPEASPEALSPSASGESAPASSADTLRTLAAASVPLGDLARKYSVSQLAAFLVNPLQWRPSGRMPSLNLSVGEAQAIAMYLLRAQAHATGGAAPARVGGLEYIYYQAEIRDDFSNLDSLKAASSGVVDHFDLSHKERDENIVFVFKGSISIPRDGSYTFYTTSDDGSRLYLDSQLWVQNDGTHAAATKSRRKLLTAGEHAIRVLYFNAGGPAQLSVEIEGPELSRRAVPAEMLSHTSVPMRPVDLETVVPDPAKVASGREYFVSYGCAACHSLGGEAPTPASVVGRPKSLMELDPEQGAGCLSTSPGASAPLFSLTSAQRDALRAALRSHDSLAQALGATDRAEKLMVLFSCYNCHSRGGVGGPDAIRAQYFHVVGQADLGDEGRIPPHLTRAGYKLRSAWLADVLWHKASVRPYMATRMPQYGEENLRELPTELAEADHSGPAKPEPSTDDPALKKAGRKLVGGEGLTCIACHNFAGHASLGIPAMDLTWMSRRLNSHWFHDYLLDPQTLRPGTRMPSFWPEHKSMKPEILKGDTDAQVDAIWAYLADGTQAKLPEGMSPAQMELAATNEAIIYRNFIQGAGSRAIGVGYPEKANLAFDANNLALALVWHGKFIDAARHRTGRGEGYEAPLGDDVVQLGSAAPFAELSDQNAPWPQDSGKKAGYQMRGYLLDALRRPKFMYSYKNASVEDYTVAARVEDEPVLRREIQLQSPDASTKLYFIAARAQQITPKNEGAFVVDGKLTIKLQSGGAGTAFVRASNGLSELIVPVSFLGGHALIKEEFSW
jgi:mono/diheme cytochrome c family protein